VKKLLLLPLLLACGCSMVSGTRHADGRLTITSWRAFWKSETIAFSVADTNLSVTLTVGRSATDAEALAAVTEAAVAAAMKSAVPVP